MKRTPVTSSNIAEIGYDQPSLTLEVLFKSGGVYRYLNVPPDVHADLMSAESHGKFLNARIKANYAFVKVEGAQEHSVVMDAVVGRR